VVKVTKKKKNKKKATSALLLALTCLRVGQSHRPRNTQVYFLVSIHRNLMSKVSVTPARDSWRDGDHHDRSRQ
jgi:hypothetical protein